MVTRPEPLATLPMFTAEEMTELAEALTGRLRVLDAYLKATRHPAVRAKLTEKMAVCRSLSTAVLEASYHMRREPHRSMSPVICRKCGRPIVGEAFGSDATGWEHPFSCPSPNLPIGHVDAEGRWDVSDRD